MKEDDFKESILSILSIFFWSDLAWWISVDPSRMIAVERVLTSAFTTLLLEQPVHEKSAMQTIS
jgi:hypothetical protein